MKSIALILVVFSYASTVSAGMAECATINDHDTRMLCFASESRNTSYCEFIKDHDIRVRCRILAGK